MSQLQWNFKRNDEYLTPPAAVYPVMKRLRPGTTVWCPFDKSESSFVRVLSENGFRVIFSHMETGGDFFRMPVPACDYIVSNPPYSRKYEILKRLYETGIPFAMLINFQGIFDCRERFLFFRERGVEMLWLYPRVDYVRTDGGITNAPFRSGYFCRGICKSPLEFDLIEPEKRG